jgi:outer membrane protein assembly factor BamB
VPLESGWSSPVAAEGRAFATDRDGQLERVLAVDIDSGKILWKSTNPVNFDPHSVGRRHGNGPKSTPVFSGGKLYTLGIAGMLQCLDAKTGVIQWRVHLPAAFGRHEPLPDQMAYVNGTDSVIVPIGKGQGAPVPLFGYTGSPVIEGNQLILSVGGQRGGTIMSFDKRNGKVLWKSLRENVSYSSPVVATLSGIRQVVVMTGPNVVGLDLHDGQLLWSHPFQIQYDESIGTPVVSGDTVLVTGDGHPLTALAIHRSGKDFRAEVAWTFRDLSSYVSSPVAADGYVWGMNDGGEFGCVRISDGKQQWLQGNHGFYCTPVLADDQLLALNEKGELLVIDASPQAYRPLTTWRVAESDTWTAPALAEGRLLIRCQAGLRCFLLTP